MKTKVDLSMSMVVPQALLNDNNYPDWSVRIRTYLMVRDLWEIVAPTDDDEPPKQQEDDAATFKAKNLMALHVIQNGCGPEPFDLIRNINSAKTAWDVLATKYKNQPPKVVLEILQGSNNYLDWSAQVRGYFMAIDVWNTIEMVKEPPQKEVDDDDAFNNWRKKDLLALHLIQNACGPVPFDMIRDKNSAKDAWLRLAAVFGPNPKIPNTVSVGVRELLDKKNYDRWRVRIRTYLELEDCWDAVEGEPPKNPFYRGIWRRRNSGALRVIKESCGPTMMSVIEKCDSAKDAWEKLSEAAKQSGNRPDLTQVTQLRKAVMKCNWSVMMNCIEQGPPKLRTEKIAVDGDTALHWAVLHDNTSIVKQLVALMSAEELEAENNKGMTALAKVAACGNIQMAECMLKKNSKLISIADKKNRIPVVRALEYGVTDLARYLYERTPLQVLESNDTYVPTIVVSCIFANAFDIALDLLQRTETPEWSIRPDIYGNSPLLALASQPSISFSRSRLLFWERWTYACIPGQLVHSTTYKRKELNEPINETRIDINKQNQQQSHEVNIYGSGVPEQLVHSTTYKRKELNEPINETRIDIDKQNQQQSHEVNVYGSVLRLLYWILPNLLKLLGMKHVYELRVRHVQALELQSLLCKVVSNPIILGFGKEFFVEIFLKAVKAGNHELIENILREDPRLQLLTDLDSRSLFAYAVLYRQPRIFSLIYGLEAKEELINMPDKFNNTLLHMVGMLERAIDQIERIPGAALEMRRELQWFKEIEDMSSPFTKEMKNDSGETAKEIFTKNHKNMKNAGEKWMKETASSSSVVGTLIITITFAATITVPGGNNGDTGFPIFSEKPIFLLFIISNALSLISSITAVLTFLVILTTSYAEEDFLISLPRKMLIGLSTLSFSIATMIIAFCAALFIIMPRQLWITTPVICLSFFPVILFLSYKYSNLVEMTKSAYGPHMFDRKLKLGPYPTNIEASPADVNMNVANFLKTFAPNLYRGFFSSVHRRGRFNNYPSANNPNSI